MDVEMRMTDGAPVPFINAAAHAIFFYISWVFTPLILIVSLLAPGKRCLHDTLAGVIVVRRTD